jgi:hypothetical protein
MTRSSIAYIVAVLATATACTPRAGSSLATESADASVSFQSAIVTTPATWTSLYGSWPALRFDNSEARSLKHNQLTTRGKIRNKLLSTSIFLIFPI